MLMQNFGVTNKEHYGICYGIFWSGQLHITHSEKKFLRTTKAGGLNGLRSAKKREEFTWIKEGVNYNNYNTIKSKERKTQRKLKKKKRQKTTAAIQYLTTNFKYLNN